jgi:hypothetical protein
MERLALAAAAVFLLAPAALLTPRASGTARELPAAESLLNHVADLRVDMALQSACRGNRWTAASALTPTAGTRQRALLAALLRLPGHHAARAWRCGARGQRVQAFALTNALLLLGALAVWLFAAPNAPRWLLMGAALLVVSPIGWFMRLTHAGVYSSLVLVALVCWRRRAGETTLAALALAEPAAGHPHRGDVGQAASPAPGRARAQPWQPWPPCQQRSTCSTSGPSAGSASSRTRTST